MVLHENLCLSQFQHTETKPLPKPLLVNIDLQQSKAGWWFESVWKIWVRQLELLFPIYGKIKHVPNHQAVQVWFQLSMKTCWVKCGSWTLTRLAPWLSCCSLSQKKTLDASVIVDVAFFLAILVPLNANMFPKLNDETKCKTHADHGIQFFMGQKHHESPPKTPWLDRWRLGSLGSACWSCCLMDWLKGKTHRKAWVQAPPKF